MHETGISLKINAPLQLPTQEILQVKTDALVHSVDAAIRGGELRPDLVRNFKSGTPRTHDDLMMVYLGLKPLTSMLSIEVYGFNKEFYDRGFFILDYLRHIPDASQGGTNLRFVLAEEFNGDVFAVWNPPLVKKTIDAHRDAFGTVTPDPYKIGFGFGIKELSEYPTTPVEDRSLGLLHGIPKDTIELYVEHREGLEDLCDEVADAAIFDEEMLLQPAGQVTYNEKGVRDRLLAHIDQGSIFVNPSLLEYIRMVRPAEVPGFRYVTTGPISDHEEKISKIWGQTGINTKLEALLQHHGV